MCLKTLLECSYLFQCHLNSITSVILLLCYFPCFCLFVLKLKVINGQRALKHKEANALTKGSWNIIPNIKLNKSFRFKTSLLSWNSKTTKQDLRLAGLFEMLTITKYFLGHTIKVYSPRDYLQIRYLILSLLSLHLTEFTNQCIEGYQLLTNNNISQTHKGSHIQRSLGEDSLRWEASWLLEADKSGTPHIVEVEVKVKWWNIISNDPFHVIIREYGKNQDLKGKNRLEQVSNAKESSIFLIWTGQPKRGGEW